MHLPHSPEYEEALAFEREEVRRKLKEQRARVAAKELFGGTSEQIEETYKLLMED